MSPASTDPAPSEVAEPDGPVTLGEISHLWWFADGSIMDVGTREHLRRSWGLCTRHAWLYLRLEVELRIDPLGNAVLMADLVERAVHVIRSHRTVHHKQTELAANDTCFTCDYGGTGLDRFAPQLRSVITGSRAAAWCMSCQPAWQPRMCPTCAPRPDQRHAIRCRRHALDCNYSEHELDYLACLAQRMAVCMKTMTFDGPDRSVDSDAALVEAIGWCCGWRPELALRRWTSATSAD